MNKKRHHPAPIIDNLAHIDPHTGNLINTGGSVEAIKLRSQYYLDYQVTCEFLSSYSGSRATFNSYRRDIERLLQWCWNLEEKSIVDLNRDDIDRFIRFIKRPPAAWIGTKNVSRFSTINGLRVANPKWRPFVLIKKTRNEYFDKDTNQNYSPSDASIIACFSTLSSFYEYLVEESQITANPVKQIRQKTKYVSSIREDTPPRRITNFQWDFVIETARIMADEEPAVHERTLFIMSSLYCMYLRISELASDERSHPVMSDFYKDTDNNWWFKTIGKGKKKRSIVVSNDMLASLSRYRLHLGLSPYPKAHSDSTPLISKRRGDGPITSTGQIRKIVQLCFDRSIRRMIDQGLNDETDELRLATVHWLRHTGISEDVKTRPREHVQADAGHDSPITTERYVNSVGRERHLSGSNKPIVAS